MSTLSLHMTAMMLTHKSLGGHFDWRCVLFFCCYGYAYLCVTSVCTFSSVTCGVSHLRCLWHRVLKYYKVVPILNSILHCSLYRTEWRVSTWNDGKWRETATCIPVLFLGSSSFPNLEVMTFGTLSEAKNYLRMTYWLIGYWSHSCFSAHLKVVEYIYHDKFSTGNTVAIFSVFHIHIFVPLSFPLSHSLGFSLLFCYSVKLSLLLCAAVLFM